MLGDIHDCDGMLTRVEGIRSLETLLRTRRELLFARFRELWEAQRSTFDELESRLRPLRRNALA